MVSKEPRVYEPDGKDIAHVVDLVKGDVTGVLDVLLLLPVPRGLLEGLNDKGRGGGNNGNGGLPAVDASEIEILEPRKSIN